MMHKDWTHSLFCNLSRASRRIIGVSLAGLALWVATPALVAARQRPSPQSPATSSNLRSEAVRLDQQRHKLCDEGRYDEAIPLAVRVLAICEKVLGTEHPDTATALNNLAFLYKSKSAYGLAEPLYQRALAIKQKSLGINHPDTAMLLNNLAELYRAKGDDARAELLNQRALAIRENALGASHPDTAQSLNNLGVLYESRGDYKRAEPLLQRALAIRENALGAEHPDTAQALNSLAFLYESKGDYMRAEPLYQCALAICEKVSGAEHPDTATLLNNLAALSRAKGDYGRAEPLYRRALAITEKSLDAKHSDTAMSLSNLAGLYEAKGDYARAEPLLLRAAEIREHNLTQILLAGSEQQKQLYLNTFSGDTYTLVSFNTRAMPMNERATRLALTGILQRKGRVLDVTTEQIGVLRRRANPQDRQLLDQLLATRTQLATLQVGETSKLSPEHRRAQIARLEDDAERLEATISRRSAEFRAQIQPITLAGVQQAMPPDAALIEFFVYYPFDAKAKTNEQWGKPRYVAYALKRVGAPKFVDLGEAEAIDRAVAVWREALRDKGRADVKRLARTLDELVMRPVRGLVGETHRWLISPDGALNLIPFAALVDEKDEYLVRNYAISYLTSGRDLLRLQVARASKQAPLVVADPDFDAPASGQAAAGRGQGTKPKQQSSGGQSTQAAQVSGMPEPAGLALNLAQFNATPLPGTAEEARAIKSLLPEAVVLTAAQATETALKQATAPRLLHIATHGFFLEDQSVVQAEVNRRLKQVSDLFTSAGSRPIGTGDNPLLRSGLALAGFNRHRSGDDDGVLTALETTGLNLWGTQMVILSACDTGVGTVKNGQGVYGLRRALVLAGAETQVMSLWPVSDVGTRDLMTEYYKALQGGQGRSEGLRQVQLKLLADPKRQHPYYWASFIQSGEWASLDGKR